MSIRNAVAALFLLLLGYWVVESVPLAELGRALAGVSPWAVLWVTVVFLLQQFLRALRQQWIVQASVPGSSYRGNLSVLCMSFFCINTFPARLGELVRPPLLAEREGLTIGAGFSVVFIERVLDLFFALATLLAVLVFMTDGREVAVVQGASVDFRSIATGMALGAVLPAVIGLVWMSLAPQSCLAFSLRILGGMLRLLPKAKGEGIRERLEGLAVSFVDGFAAMRQPGRLLRILLLTGVTWALTGFLYVGLAYGFEGLGGEVGWTEGMAILVITMLGTAIPSLPGFAGVYEGAVMAAFVLLGLGSQPEVQGLAFGLVVHWVTYAAQSTTAFYFFFRDGVRVRELWAQIRRSQTA